MPSGLHTSNIPSGRLGTALQDNELETLRSTKRKVDDGAGNLSRKSARKSSDVSQTLRSYKARYSVARKAAMEVFKGGHSRNVAMRVFDQVYQHGSYNPALIGKEQKPNFDWSDPRTARLDKDAIDQIWAWQLKLKDNDEEAEPLSPKSRVKSHD